MFDRVARRYDFANHLLSFGQDFFWRRRAAEIVAEWNPACVLDLATGSGDLALALQDKIPRAQIVGLDFSSAMLALARGKGVRQLIVADVAQLPLA
jgi:demethylmenaquinone methyltransferase/2-methoxy-6-polyprenyl-1,4-benzoquinol methylase